MNRGLTEDEIERLFLHHWREKRDAREVAILLYEAGRDGVEVALSNASKRSRRRDREARRILPDHLKERAARVLLAIAARHNTTVDDLLEKQPCGGGGPVAEAMWCLRRTVMSFPSVAVAVRRENHTTVISACERVERRFEQLPELRSELETIVRSVLNEESPAEAAA